jgi:hypothetical protein
MLCVVWHLGIFSLLSFDEDFLTVIPGVTALLSYQCCHSRTLSLFPSLLDLLRLILGLRFFLFFGQVLIRRHQRPEARSSSYEKRSLGCIGEIGP